jgi:hypothetical protein
VNCLATTSFVYILIKLNAFVLFQSEQLKFITDFQINCNGHIMKSQSSNSYLSIDIDHHLSGERAPLLKRLVLELFALKQNECIEFDQDVDKACCR